MINLDVATGDLFYLTSHLMPPLKLSPPYQHAEAIGANHTTQICHAETGRQYIGLAGGEHCAEYEIYADVAAEQPTCTELKHICKKDCEIQCTQMLLHHYEYDSCVPGEYKVRSYLVWGVFGLGFPRSIRSLPFRPPYLL